jgi:cob(I)alamin adenosyltransferase
MKGDVEMGAEQAGFKTLTTKGKQYMGDRRKIKEQTRKIYDVLPKLDDRLCGYETCAEFARAVAEGRAACHGCVTGGLEVAAKVCEIVGVEVPEEIMQNQHLVGKGYVQVYTGDCKGKTTAALGLAFRAMGRGLKTYVGQFMKGKHYGELDAARMVQPYITIEQYGKDTFVHVENPPHEEDVRMAIDGLAKAEEAMVSGKYDIIVLDEINTAHYFNLISTEAMLGAIRNKPDGVELVFTGRYAPRELIDAADLVTEMVEVKHYYQKGISARDGIER